MQTEMESLRYCDMWDLVPIPEGRKAIGSKWVFKLKTNADGSVERCKAWLVETFSPVVRPESVRSVIALSCQEGLKLHQMDITTAFLNGDLEETVYINQLEGFIANGQEHLVCRLKKSLYGLKKFSRCWNLVLHSHLKSMGFTQSANDPCIYTSVSNDLIILSVYVDDILIAAKSQRKIDQVKADIGRKF